MPSSSDCPALLEAQNMFVRKFLVSLVFAAVFAEALAALAEYAAVENAAATTTIGTMATASEPPVS
ncbi:MAG: hypothetical protein H6R00_1860 [Proteobacteria bacterium]|nr:hypothetical protein [Pseudomonadota bacterium]